MPPTTSQLFQNPEPPLAGWSVPEPMSRIDRLYRLRKGTAMAAAKAGQLKAVFRRGRGGTHAYALSVDAEDWFKRGLPTESEVTS